MVKKTLLSLAVATALVSITGCNVSTTDRHENKIIDSHPGQKMMPSPTASTYPLFDPANSKIPMASDLVFGKAAETDGTAASDLTPSKTSPVTTALQQLAGFSTVASLYIEFESDDDQLVDTPVPVGSVWLINASTNQPLLDGMALGYEARFVKYNEQEGKPDAAKYALQILPKVPLDPATQYLVILTDEIKDGAGNPIGQSSMHVLLSDTSEGVIYPSNALVPAAEVVRTWNAVAAGALDALKGHPMLGGLLDPEAKSVLAYTFRTDDGMTQMEDYAAPVNFFEKKHQEAVDAEDTAKAAALAQLVGALKNPTLPGAEGIVTAVMGGLEAPRARDAALIPVTLVDGAFNEAAAQKMAQGMVAADPTGNTKFEDIIDGVRDQVNTQNPSASPSTILAQGDTSNPFYADTFTRFIQGQIELPNFLPAAETSPLADKLWTANDALAGLGIAPPADTDGSTNVTYHFPFPKPVGTNTAPLLITMPDTVTYGAGAFQDCSGLTEFPVVIYVHGITGSRGNMLPYASALASNCIATVGIDLPLHGVAPKGQDGSDNALIVFNTEPSKAALTGSPWGGVAAQIEVNGEKPFANLAERHNNTYQLATPTQARTPIVFGENALGDSGSAFINLQNFGRTRDNLRQGVTDLLNLNASLSNISDELKKQGKAGLDLTNVYVAGHSLGGIVASAFVAANNAAQATNPQLNEVKGLIIANSGGHITKMLESSPAFAPTILGGLARSGVMQGTEDFEKFLYVFQSIVDGVDPANTASNFGDIPVQLLTVVGDGVSAPLHPVAQALPDTTVPVRDYFAEATTNPFAELVKPECFADSEADGCNAGGIALPSANVPTAKSYFAGTQSFVKATGLNPDSEMKETTYRVASHSTFADAGSSMPIAAQAAAQANFMDMVTKSVILIKMGAATADAK